MRKVNFLRCPEDYKHYTLWNAIYMHKPSTINSVTRRFLPTHFLTVFCYQCHVKTKYVYCISKAMLRDSPRGSFEKQAAFAKFFLRTNSCKEKCKFNRICTAINVYIVFVWYLLFQPSPSIQRVEKNKIVPHICSQILRNCCNDSTAVTFFCCRKKININESSFQEHGLLIL